MVQLESDQIVVTYIRRLRFTLKGFDSVRISE